MIRAAVVGLLLLLPAGVGAQEASPEPTAPVTAVPERALADDMWDLGALAKFVGGAAVGLGLHESGHVFSGAILGADPGVKPISYGPIPFFAITHQDVPPAREYTIAASGFFVQHAASEWLLTHRPNLRAERAPALKGVLAFNVLTSTVYATAAFGGFGPPERDTRAMADALGVAEPWVGALVLAPAALDAWRYVRPHSRWASWLSRAVKAGAVVAVVRAAR